MKLDYFLDYLIAVNILSFALTSVDFLLYIKGKKGLRPQSILELLLIIGGSLGINVAFLLWDRKLTKENLTWRIVALGLLIIQLLLVLILYGPKNDLARAWLKNYYQKHMFFVWYLLIVNVITLILFFIDKIKAMLGRWRIRILILLGLSFIGGSLGGLLGMYACNHKTNRTYFSVGLPLMIIVQSLLLFYFTVYLGL